MIGARASSTDFDDLLLKIETGGGGIRPLEGDFYNDGGTGEFPVWKFGIGSDFIRNQDFSGLHPVCRTPPCPACRTPSRQIAPLFSLILFDVFLLAPTVFGGGAALPQLLNLLILGFPEPMHFRGQ